MCAHQDTGAHALVRFAKHVTGIAPSGVTSIAAQVQIRHMHAEIAGLRNNGNKAGRPRQKGNARRHHPDGSRALVWSCRRGVVDGNALWRLLC